MSACLTNTREVVVIIATLVSTASTLGLLKVSLTASPKVPEKISPQVSEKTAIFKVSVSNDYPTPPVIPPPAPAPASVPQTQIDSIHQSVSVLMEPNPVYLTARSNCCRRCARTRGCLCGPTCNCRRARRLNH